MSRLIYHDIGNNGQRYPFAIRELTTARGAYVIRDKHTKRVLYVGSSAKRLYSTLTRHMQGWRRNKKWWKDQYSKSHDPGVTYDRNGVEVAVIVQNKQGDHLKLEAALIARFRPRDNLVERPDGGTNEAELEAVPF